MKPKPAFSCPTSEAKTPQNPFFLSPSMNSRRDYRGNRAALFDGIEEGGIRASSSYASHEIDEHENDRALDGLEDRVNILKRLTGDIHEEVESHNSVLDRMGNDMDASRGVLSGTMDRFKMVFETKSSRRMATLVASFVVLFLLIYYLTK
ncbi:bet1-like SNARE 1-1 [Tasmannia lanceolata]|uniref:bet1-like SNARE 1-1 n=1 Tax=Tasmannia lanceolata TaxID=3420 RepID=UPI0040631A6C